MKINIPVDKEILQILAKHEDLELNEEYDFTVLQGVVEDILFRHISDLYSRNELTPDAERIYDEYTDYVKWRR